MGSKPWIQEDRTSDTLGKANREDRDIVVDPNQSVALNKKMVNSQVYYNQFVTIKKLAFVEKEMFHAYISALATSEEFACYTLLGKRTLKNPKNFFKVDLPFLNKALTEVAESSRTMQEELDTLLFKQMSNAGDKNKYEKLQLKKNIIFRRNCAVQQSNISTENLYKSCFFLFNFYLVQSS